MKNIKSISKERVLELETGLCSSTNLMEILAIDFAKLWNNTFSEHHFTQVKLGSFGVVKRMSYCGEKILELKVMPMNFLSHPSDTVRGWVAFSIGIRFENFTEAMNHIKPFANDSHFAVREWAWLALRHHVVSNPLEALKFFESWGESDKPNMRRFAVEITRPRGVWAKHIQLFKNQPWLAEDFLNMFVHEQNRYVQNSVANWLNDAAKTHKDWVQEFLDSWLKLSPTKATQYIVKRAGRSIKAC